MISSGPRRSDAVSETPPEPLSGSALPAIGRAPVNGELQREIATWSSQSRHEGVDARNNTHVACPDVVIRAVRDVVGDVRTVRNSPG